MAELSAADISGLKFFPFPSLELISTAVPENKMIIG